jgi:hypothetical protein
MSSSAEGRSWSNGSSDSTSAQTANPTSPAVGLWASIVVIFRRWPLVLLGLVLTGAACFGVYTKVPVTYGASGSLLLEVPEVAAPAPGSTIPLNPILGTRAYIGDLLTTIMANPEEAAKVAANGGTGSFETSLGQGQAALVQLETTGATPEEALTTWSVAAAATSEALLSLQEAKGAPADQLVTVSPITEPLEATKQSGGRLRALIATAVLGIGLTLLLVFGVESLMQHRRSTKGGGARGTGSEPSREDAPGSGNDSDPASDQRAVTLPSPLPRRDLRLAYGPDAGSQSLRDGGSTPPLVSGQ